eukprot:509029-Pleurochrysis_carterae.AAC.3
MPPKRLLKLHMAARWHARALASMSTRRELRDSLYHSRLFLTNIARTHAFSSRYVCRQAQPHALTPARRLAHVPRLPSSCARAGDGRPSHARACTRPPFALPGALRPAVCARALAARAGEPRRVVRQRDPLGYELRAERTAARRRRL